MNLNKIAQIVKESGQPRNCFNIIIYAEPKTGKTELAATIAKVPWIKNVYWFDIENGSDTLIRMTNEGKLTLEEASKITIYSIPDTSAIPRAMETVVKCLTVKKDHTICELHGKIDCVECRLNAKTKEFVGDKFNIDKCTNDDVIVIDTGSALAVSILNYYLMGKSQDYKPGWDEYNPQGRMLNDVFLTIQNARTNFIVTAHTIGVEFKDNDKDVEKLYPQIGTKNFSRTVCKFFSHVLFLEIKLGLHKGGSSTDYRKDALTGSRGGWRLEDQKELDLSKLFEQMQIKPKAATKA